MKVSILIPVYNEQETLREILRRVRAVDLSVNGRVPIYTDEPVHLEKEIVVVDDGSTDGSGSDYRCGVRRWSPSSQSPQSKRCCVTWPAPQRRSK